MKRLTVLIFASLVLLASCDKEDNNDEGNLNLSFTGLNDLGDDAQYEGWIMVNGTPVSTGTFTVDNAGTLSQTSFSLNADDLAAATAFILTIEPKPDTDPAPSDVHILAGDFNGNNASLSIGDSRAIGNDFTAATGQYVIGTPTTADTTDGLSGVWFVNPGTSSASLDLPTLPAGWMYEGWGVINGEPVSTGKFTDVSAADASSLYSGTEPGPPFPGEDFINNAPAGLSFPTDLSGMVIAISVEPVPDNSSMPFFFKPLVGDVPANVMPGDLNNLNNNTSGNVINGTAMR